MLRIHCVQLFHNVSDPAMEDMLYEIGSVRRFVGVTLSGPIPDETTILKFLHLLERHRLGSKLLNRINRHLDREGLVLKEGTIVDASLIAAPISTKNQKGELDPEMYQTRKGNEWYFGMKLHIGVDETFGLVHSLSTTAGRVHDNTQVEHLLHGKEDAVWGDAGYAGVHRWAAHQDRDATWFIAQRPGKRRKMARNSLEAGLERTIASMRAKVEHPFQVIKRVFGYSKVRYRGLQKNEQRLAMLCGFTNLMPAEPYLAI